MIPALVVSAPRQVSSHHEKSSSFNSGIFWDIKNLFSHGNLNDLLWMVLEFLEYLILLSGWRNSVQEYFVRCIVCKVKCESLCGIFRFLCSCRLVANAEHSLLMQLGSQKERHQVYSKSCSDLVTKCPNFTWYFPKNIFPNFWGKCPLPLPLSPMPMEAMV